MDTTLFLVAKITPKADYFQVAKQAIIDIIPQTRNEPGCIEFTLLEDNVGSLFLYEQWTNEQALQQHYEMPYTRQVFQRYQSWLAQQPEITKLTKVK